MSNFGDLFHQQTKYSPQNIHLQRPDWTAQPPLYKQYQDCPKIKLEPLSPPPKLSLDKALRTRKSIRSFDETPITMAQLSYLLWAASGIQRTEAGYEFRTAPSAGALYPIETYVIANNIENLQPGLYHYAVINHHLEQLEAADYRRRIAEAALGQAVCAAAAAVFVFSAIFQRSKFKYGQRAYRYIYLDAGHIAQNLALAAVSLSLGSCQIGALYDDQVNAILDIDGKDESAIYISAVGHPA